MDALRKLTGEEFWGFVQAHYAVAVLLDASWDGNGQGLRACMLRTAANGCEAGPRLERVGMPSPF